jgi:hypothetical protein
MDLVHSSLEAKIERLLSSLAGVVSARVVVGPQGEVEEIHVLATPAVHPKQVVRNVESALSAGLGVVVDRRTVSVAQVRDEFLDGVGAEPEPVEAEAAEPPLADGQRLEFVRYDARLFGIQEAHCHVVLRRGRDEFSGAGQGPNTPQGRAEAAARALFAAVVASRGSDDVALEGAALVETNGRTFVLVAAHGLTGRQTVPLTGAAPLGRSAEEAAILASLQATNRWVELPS